MEVVSARVKMPCSYVYIELYMDERCYAIHRIFECRLVPVVFQPLCILKNVHFVVVSYRGLHKIIAAALKMSSGRVVKTSFSQPDHLRKGVHIVPSPRSSQCNVIMWQVEITVRWFCSAFQIIVSTTPATHGVEQ